MYANIFAIIINFFKRRDMSIIKTVGKILLCLFLAIVLASAATWFMLRRSSDDWIRSGPWRTSLTAGTQTSGMYSRALNAVAGIGSMRPSEALYFMANTDSDGEPLSHASTYRIEGQDPDAQWWSLVAYAGIYGSLIPNPLNIYSVSMTTVTRNPDGSWTVRLSRQKQPDNWLPLAEQDTRLTLIFRCFGPSSALLDNPAASRLPQIILEDGQ